MNQANRRFYDSSQASACTAIPEGPEYLVIAIYLLLLDAEVGIDGLLRGKLTNMKT